MRRFLRSSLLLGVAWMVCLTEVRGFVPSSLRQSCRRRGGGGVVVIVKEEPFSQPPRRGTSTATATTRRTTTSTRLYSSSDEKSSSPADKEEEQEEEATTTWESLRPETSFGADAVPEAQRPVNEYLDVTQRQPLFGWADTQPDGDRGLAVRLAAVYAVAYGALCLPIAGATYHDDARWWFLPKILAANVGAVSLVAVVLFRIYVGWSYVGDRLSSRAIEYEETGWYDGDVEFKSPTEWQRDRFLYRDKVRPVLGRLRVFGAGLAAAWVASLVAYQAAVSYYRPVAFDEYDPALLGQMTYDERLAKAAAQAAGGKPAYCDSRYYRAIANGGQGCD